eukprot:CAMPEP_0204897294 /NCGR_PEP_ID=MMETSP1397-20131031/654_1 /ASSEMBLY_ACC=CAM_ASM_000891 /TAXON_ID=49980 /ORGANISM="Climacostomum Climacostomum virens, Strain Stock W-24" /LENGTH=343 /DNA_ID=CAMNT_0052065023 /DNA_START=2098 /DNA_END=3129 /DNA_ORIENTATION=-
MSHKIVPSTASYDSELDRNQQHETASLQPPGFASKFILSESSAQNFERVTEDLRYSDARETELLPSILQTKLSNSLKKIRDRPIEYYESLLYDITCFFTVSLCGVLPKLAAVELFHPLKKLQDIEPTLPDYEKHLIVQAVESLVENHSYAQLDYKMLSMVMELMSGLLVKWDLIREYEYSYRYRESVFSSKVIDINALHSGVISMEVLYFACVVNKPPLEGIMHQTVKHYSSIVLDAALTAVNALLSLTDADFSKFPSISGYLASRNPLLVSKYGMLPDHSLEKPNYHELLVRSGCRVLCTSTKQDKQNIALKEVLIDFELAYRHFETVLVKDLAHLKSIESP